MNGLDISLIVCFGAFWAILSLVAMGDDLRWAGPALRDWFSERLTSLPSARRSRCAVDPNEAARAHDSWG